MLPEAVRRGIELALGPVERIELLSGGSITRACRLTAGGDAWFLKYAIDPPPDFFAVEAAGLQALRGVASDVRVPEVVALGTEGSASWLVLEWLAPGRTPDFPARLGRGLARVHRSQAEGWGWDRDGFIGSLPQSNRVRSSWPEFWWNERLLPQLTMAEGRFIPRVDHEEVRAALERVLRPVENEGASLLHGDLWGGNVMDTAEGPALFDPACYFGHREADLAMTELFGGFDGGFYTAYDEVWPRRPGYRHRRAAYQLYYLLVHVNLFGGSYAARTRDKLGDLLAS